MDELIDAGFIYYLTITFLAHIYILYKHTNTIK